MDEYAQRLSRYVKLELLELPESRQREPERAKAERSLSLSKLTLPHRLARVVAAEQLYRAFTLLKGEPYHRD